METFVLIPEELSLEHVPGEKKIRVVSNQPLLPRGLRFSPFQGTLRTDGNLDSELLRGKLPAWGGLRATSWVRFLRECPQISKEVNVVEMILPGGQVIYEVHRSISYGEELVLFSTEPPLPFTKALKEAIFEETMKALLLEVPLDLSTSLFHSHKKEIWEDEPWISPTLTLLSEPSSTSPAASAKSSSKRTRSLLPCSVCSKAFDRPSLLKRHMRTHTGEKPYACDICSKGFSTSSSLNTHRRIHTGQKPHECPTCGKRFTASSNLYYHRMTHVKEKPHKCVTCSKSFPTPGDLKSHGYVHSGSWPFRCPVCKRGFSKHTNLKNHLFLHTGNKPNACNFCPKRFALACNLRAHLKTHSEEQDDPPGDPGEESPPDDEEMVEDEEDSN